MKNLTPAPLRFKKQNDYTCAWHKSENSYFYPDHWHDSFEILWVKEGSFGLKINSEDITLSPGSIVVVPPGTIHGTHSVGEMYKIYVCGYSPAVIYNFELSIDNMKYLMPFRHIIRTKNYIINPTDPMWETLSKLIEDIMSIYQSAGFEKELIIRSEILRLHAALCKCFIGKTNMSSEANSYITDAQLYIEKHITEDISPYDIAKELHISYSHFARLLKSNLGCSANELIGKMKTGYAEQLMTANPDASITDIVAFSGFNSASYFTRVFRKIRGCTPSEFRKMLRKNIDL